jgi:hypothetical protein
MNPDDPDSVFNMHVPQPEPANVPDWVDRISPNVLTPESEPAPDLDPNIREA